MEITKHYLTNIHTLLDALMETQSDAIVCGVVAQLQSRGVALRRRFVINLRSAAASPGEQKVYQNPLKRYDSPVKAMLSTVDILTRILLAAQSLF